MKLIIDGWTLQRDDVGLGVFSRRLLNALPVADDQLRVLVLLPSDDIQTPPVIERLVLKLPAIPNATLREFAWQQLVSWTVRTRFSEWIFHSPGECWLIARPKNCAVSCHDCIPAVFDCYLGRNPLRRLVFWLRQNFLRHASLVLTGSEHAKVEIIRRYRVAAENVRVIGNYVSEDFRIENAKVTAPVVREKYRLPDDYWLYVGGFDTRKNIPFLLEAYSRVRSKGFLLPKLVLAGNPPRRGPSCAYELPQLIESMSLCECVVMPGRIDSEDLAGLYGGASLSIYPSLLEGFGLPPLESMSCGCPALVADNSSLPEVVVDRDYRFSTVDTRSLEELLTRAASHPLPLNPGFDRSTFSATRFAVRYLDAIRALS